MTALYTSSHNSSINCSRFLSALLKLTSKTLDLSFENSLDTNKSYVPLLKIGDSRVIRFAC